MSVGLVSAFLLVQMGQDIRQWAAPMEIWLPSGTPTPSGVWVSLLPSVTPTPTPYGVGSECDGFAKEGQTYCAGTNLGDCRRCVKSGDGILRGAEEKNDDACAGLWCGPGKNSDYSKYHDPSQHKCGENNQGQGGSVPVGGFACKGGGVNDCVECIWSQNRAIFVSASDGEKTNCRARGYMCGPTPAPTQPAEPTPTTVGGVGGIDTLIIQQCKKYGDVWCDLSTNTENVCQYSNGVLTGIKARTCQNRCSADGLSCDGLKVEYQADVDLACKTTGVNGRYWCEDHILRSCGVDVWGKKSIVNEQFDSPTKCFQEAEKSNAKYNPTLTPTSILTSTPVPTQTLLAQPSVTPQPVPAFRLLASCDEMCNAEEKCFCPTECSLKKSEIITGPSDCGGYPPNAIIPLLNCTDRCGYVAQCSCPANCVKPEGTIINGGNHDCDGPLTSTNSPASPAPTTIAQATAAPTSASTPTLPAPTNSSNQSNDDLLRSCFEKCDGFSQCQCPDGCKKTGDISEGNNCNGNRNFADPKEDYYEYHNRCDKQCETGSQCYCPHECALNVIYPGDERSDCSGTKPATSASQNLAATLAPLVKAFQPKTIFSLIQTGWMRLFGR